MAFEIPADSYDRFMGRYSGPFADRLLGLAGAAAGDRALDVGCGPGAMTSRLVARLGAEAVAAIDPSESFVAAARERCPGVDVRLRRGRGAAVRRRRRSTSRWRSWWSTS